ncbi:MAG TPA: ATP-binding protein [Candidatus Elarobacter sp.]|jgi:anti-sigma regulatory factor (Ser/Thr protein kinase)
MSSSDRSWTLDGLGGEHAPEWSFAASDSATAIDVRRAFRAHVERFAEPQSDVGAAELIFAELLSNVVRHAGGPLWVRLGWRRAEPVLVIADRGPGFGSRPACSLPATVDDAGRGLAIVRALALHLRLGNRRRRGAYVCAVLPVSRAVRAG